MVSDAESETKIIVGGLLARYEYDLLSCTDPHFLLNNRTNALASEVKTHTAFAPGDMWYHGSKGIQVLSAMYSYHCPTFLLSHKQWKLFVENRDRNAVLTFPFDDHVGYSSYQNSTLVQPMGRSFLKAIVICLLSQRHFPDNLDSKVMSSDVSAPARETPQKTATKSKYFDSQNESSRRRSPRLKTRPKPPTFISGYVDGEPVYSEIRMVPSNTVAAMESSVVTQKKKPNPLQQQESAMTLFE